MREEVKEFRVGDRVRVHMIDLNWCAGRIIKVNQVHHITMFDVKFDDARIRNPEIRSYMAREMEYEYSEIESAERLLGEDYFA